MIFKNYHFRLLIKVILLFVTIIAASLIIVKGWFVYLIIVLPVILYQMVDFYRFNRKAQDEVQQFVESVHYRDFSRYFDVKHAPDRKSTRLNSSHLGIS